MSTKQSKLGRATAAAAFVGALVSQPVGIASACEGAECAAQAKICDAPATQAAAPQPQAAAGMRVSIDPLTGQYTESPGASSQAEALAAPSIVPKQEALAGGGFKLDTRGVRHAYVATANPGGLPQTHCIEATHPGAEPPQD